MEIDPPGPVVDKPVEIAKVPEDFSPNPEFIVMSFAADIPMFPPGDDKSNFPDTPELSAMLPSFEPLLEFCV
jgi:hypothetical protein